MPEIFETPNSMRLKIAVFGRTNSGKSSIINAICSQRVSLVSEVSGTTTDPVNRAMEIYPLGPCVLVDTAGFGDETELGEIRTERTRAVMEGTDLAVMVLSPETEELFLEKDWLRLLEDAEIPTVCVLNKADLVSDISAALEKIKAETGALCVAVSALTGTGMAELKAALIEKAPKDFEQSSITGHIARRGDTVLLVMPQQINAP